MEANCVPDTVLHIDDLAECSHQPSEENHAISMLQKHRLFRISAGHWGCRWTWPSKWGRNTALFRKPGTGGHGSGTGLGSPVKGGEGRTGGEEPRAEPSRSRGWSGEARRALPSPSTWREADTGEAGPAEFPTDPTAAVERMGVMDKTAGGGWIAGGCGSGNGLVPCPHPAEKLSPGTKGLVAPVPGPFPHIRPNKRIHVWTKEHLRGRNDRPPARAVAVQMERRRWGKAQFWRSNRQELVIHWMWVRVDWLDGRTTHWDQKKNPEIWIQITIPYSCIWVLSLFKVILFLKEAWKLCR